MPTGLNPAEVTFTDHFKRQFRAKGFTTKQVGEALAAPYKVTRVTRHPGQLRYCGGGIAVVMDGTRAITCYLDGVVTEIREDQRHDPAARTSRRLAQHTR